MALLNEDERIRVVRLMPVLDYGGVETCTKILGEQLDPSRFDVRVCTFWKAGHVAEQLLAQDIPVDILEANPEIFNFEAFAKLFSYLRRVKPHIVHSAIAEANFYVGLAGRAAGVPILIGEEVGTPTRSIAAELVLGLVYRLFDRIVGVSNATCRYLIDQEHAPAERVELVYNPIDEEYLSEFDRNYDFEDGFTILTVGRLAEEKNHVGLLRVLERVVDVRKDVKLRIAGDGILRERVESEIAALGLQRHVELLGFRKDVLDLLSDSDLFVLPSVAEGYGIALVEAMATGIPVIGTTAGGVPEVMGELVNEWAIEPTDYEAWARAILEMMEMSPAQRREIGERARSIASSRFAPQVYATRIRELYEEILLEKDIVPNHG